MLDMEVIGLSVTNPTSLTLDLDVDNIVTFTVRLQNSGLFSIESPDSGNNFAVAFVLSNTTDITASDAGVSVNYKYYTRTSLKTLYIGEINYRSSTLYVSLLPRT